MTDKTFDARLESARRAIETALEDPEIQNLLVEHGYPQGRLAVGRRRYDNVVEALRTLQAQRETYEAVTERFTEETAEARAIYLRLRDLARQVACDIPGIPGSLSLDEEVPEPFEAWLEDAKIFYELLMSDSDVLEALGELGLARHEIRSARKHLLQAEGLHTDREQEKTALESAIDARDCEMLALDAWMEEFRSVSVGAFEEHPQKLTALGLTRPSL
jgi:hypothetical protein